MFRQPKYVIKITLRDSDKKFIGKYYMWPEDFKHFIDNNTERLQSVTIDFVYAEDILDDDEYSKAKFLKYVIDKAMAFRRTKKQKIL
jgi:hypothetical protein